MHQQVWVDRRRQGMKPRSIVLPNSVRSLPEPVMLLLKPLYSVSNDPWRKDQRSSYSGTIRRPSRTHSTRINELIPVHSTNHSSSFSASESWIIGIVLLVDSKTIPVLCNGPFFVSSRCRIISLSSSRGIPEPVMEASTNFLVVIKWGVIRIPGQCQSCFF